MLRRSTRLPMRTLSLALLCAMGLLMGALFLVTTLEVDTGSRRADAEKRRYESFKLADSMRQSSNDLTRMVQLYVATGDPSYRDYYNAILAIRSGEALRPRGYDSSFWDRVLARSFAGTTFGPAKSLVSLMREAGFAPDEFRALRAALRRSDGLAKVELDVMRKVNRRIERRGTDGRYFADVQPHYRRLVDDEYQREKGAIMAAIDRFGVLVNRRTAAELDSLKTRDERLLIAQIGILGLAALLGLAGFFIVARMAVRPLGQLVSATRRIAGGDYKQRAEVRAVAELEQLAEDFNVMADAVERDIDHKEAARRAAEQAEREEAEFLANMSHEIRSPMNAVIGMTTLLGDTKLSGEQEQYVDVVRSSGDHLLAIVNDVLDYSKIEAGGIALEQAPFALHRAAEDTLSLVAGEASRKQLELAYIEEGDLPDAVIGDLARLRQVLLNLLTNAIKFTESGGVTLTVAAEGPDRIRYTVRDTGTGIAADRLPSLFKRFAQADAATTRTHGGTGLGLVISKGLVELMGGEIQVESRLGAGSAFSFAIDAPHAELPSEERWDPPPGTLAGRSVAVFGSSNTGDADLLERLLERWEMEVQPSDGPRPDVILVNRSDAVLLATSSEAMDDEQFDAVVRKPLRRQALCRALLELLDGERAEQPRPGLDPAFGRDHPLRVLIAEDSSANQLALRSMLERLGYEPDVVPDGGAAIEAAINKSYDVVLMDNQMPGVDGIAATREICARLAPERRPAIISVSAGTSERYQAAAAEAGMVGRISKPVTPERLIQALKRVRPLGAHARPDARERVPSPDADQRASGGPAFDSDGVGGAIDSEALADRVGALTDDQLGRVLEDFREGGSRSLAHMADAAKGCDASTISRAAHSLLGSALLLEAGPLSAHLRQLEELTDAGDHDLPALVDRARELFAAADEALAAYLRSR